ncbi:MAG: hypothetical protein JJ714_03630 [Acidithiobacillus sp.]|nr:hypothetical protein [Acidithiobacillus sp.]
MIPLEIQYRIIDRVKSDPETWKALSHISPDGVEGVQPFLTACVGWMHRGGQEEIKRRREQAKALHDALAAMEEHRALLEHNLLTPLTLEIGPYLKTDAKLGTGPVLDSVMQVMDKLAHDLTERNPESMQERRDRQFFVLLGKEFERSKLPRPKVTQLRELWESLKRAVLSVAPDLLPDIDLEDADVINAYARGVGMLQEKTR